MNKIAAVYIEVADNYHIQIVYLFMGMRDN